jgi:hypothetical protein
VNREPLRVELPVCPVEGCRRVGRLPSHFTRKGFCSGGVKNPHKPIRMEKRVFEAVDPEPVGPVSTEPQSRPPAPNRKEAGR